MSQIGEVRVGRDVGYRFGDKVIWIACVDCGKERWVQLLNGCPKSKRCRKCSMFRERARNWKGGRWKANGYWMIKIYPSDFFYPMANKIGYVLEHRLIMAKYSQRCLLPWEVVHHRNGIKDDNRFENLQLLNGKSSHIIDSVTKSYIRRLEKKICKMGEEINTLKGDKQNVASIVASSH